MTRLLMIREHLLKFYQNYTRILNPLFRFMVALITFYGINRMVGYHPMLNPWYVMTALSVVGAVMPVAVLLFLAAAYTVVHVYYVSIILALVLTIVFAILYLVYIRFVPEYGYVILLTPLLFVFHIPYVMPIVLGLVAVPATILPMGCGVILYYLMESITAVVSTVTEDSIALYNQAVQVVFSNREMYLTIGIFAIITIVVYVIRSYEFQFAFEVSILAGAFLNVLLFLLIGFPFDIDIHVGYLLLETLICAVLAWIAQFFRLVLNYAAVEYLQFEDDEYYYYVKAVPKVSIAAPKKNVKRFNAHLFTDGYFGIRQETKKNTAEQERKQKEEEKQKEEKKQREEREENMEQMMEKHDFDFTVAVEEKDFQEEEKSK